VRRPDLQRVELASRALVPAGEPVAFLGGEYFSVAHQFIFYSDRALVRDARAPAAVRRALEAGRWALVSREAYAGVAGAVSARFVRVVSSGEWTLVHGSPREPLWEYVTSVPVARANLAVLGSRVGLHGHTHVPVAFVEDDGRIEVVSPGDGSVLELRGRRALVNPGSVGQPRDGDPRSSFLILDTDADTVSWHRTGYDIAAVQASMQGTGLPASLATRLSVGL
jgi:diadenosine tetraphosphatase ApaH/serine/threonine PP2A family protein phosphatase